MMRIGDIFCIELRDIDRVGYDKVPDISCSKDYGDVVALRYVNCVIDRCIFQVVLICISVRIYYITD